MPSTIPTYNDAAPRPIVLGASGRLGTMLRKMWGDAAAVWHTGRAELDLCAEPAALEARLAGAPAVLCLAGVTPASGRDLAQNVDLARAALDAAARAGAGPVLLASSAAVYGRPKGPLREEAAGTPVAPYGQAKHAMEQMAAAHPHPSCALRIGNVAGSDAILGGWRDGMTLDTDEHGHTPRRSYIGPHKLAQVLALLLRRCDLPPVLNVAAPGAVHMGALLDAAGLPWTPRTAGPGVIWDVTLDTALLRRWVRFKAADSTATGLVADWTQVR